MILLSILHSCKRKLLLSFLILFSSAALVAQVTIREKITLNPKSKIVKDNKESVKLLLLSSDISGFVMKKRGVLQIWHSFAERDKSPIPFNSHLYLDIRNGDTVLTDFVVPRFNNTYSNYWNCYGVQTLRYYYSISFPYTPFSAVPVQRGDTVVIAYITDLHPEDGVLDTLGIYSTDTTQYGWDVTFHAPYTCQEEILNIFVGVADTVLKFTKPAFDSICPTIPNYNDNLSRKNWVDLELKATFGDSVMKNVWVKVDTAAIADSGGHSHNGNRPMGKYHIAKLPPATGYDTVSTFIRKTDSTGVLKFRYFASQFGGIEKIKAKLLSDTTSYDTLRIKIKVDSLYSIPIGNKYVLIGAPDDFDPCNTSTSKHYNNHYGTQNLIEAIPKIATTYDSLYPGIRLRINDMSLKFGGRFDFGNNWSGSHSQHRIGINADIGIKALNINNNCVDVVKRDLESVVWEKTLIRPKYETDPPHYHIFVKEK
ncbi:MAG: hypothetical protein C0417_10945 [Chlorobiaceae bacterium]|nr:hypothetical protein [Chlorobiaceae bacterium]